ncbi:Uncharacterized protein APZ42_009076 [Daphnia magna]|uniref:Uncharacterized protein n=1 Tax=Daphnia magna TaxID=35525 RepID=A0A164E875_9CRUS|nr:Uncharacterized protein APZ42_009076 [Daphnia magna]
MVSFNNVQPWNDSHVTETNKRCFCIFNVYIFIIVFHTSFWPASANRVQQLHGPL